MVVSNVPFLIVVSSAKNWYSVGATSCKVKEYEYELKSPYATDLTVNIIPYLPLSWRSQKMTTFCQITSALHLMTFKFTHVYIVICECCDMRFGDI